MCQQVWVSLVLGPFVGWGGVSMSAGGYVQGVGTHLSRYGTSRGMDIHTLLDMG